MTAWLFVPPHTLFDIFYKKKIFFYYTLLYSTLDMNDKGCSDRTFANQNVCINVVGIVGSRIRLQTVSNIFCNLWEDL